MITRFVKLTFREDKVADFVDIFESGKSTIRRFEGCHHLELLQDVKNPTVFFTFSIWESEAHLDTYRHSDFFASTWTKTKALFAKKPEAWSLDQRSKEEI
ncbi:MAG: antibiotic biosynthesis monooxygenase family protein [Bacteroidota bacterium]